LSEASRAYRLKKRLEAVMTDYDYIVADTPPSLSILTINALSAATGVVIPTQADTYSLEGVEQLYGTIEDIRENINPGLRLRGILLTRHNRTVLSRSMAGNAGAKAAAIGTFVYRAAVRECVSLKEAQTMKRSIYEYAPESIAAADYTAFVDEFLKRGGGDG